MLTRPSELIINNPKAIKLLSKTKTILMLQPFSLRPHSLKEASERVSISISAYSYWVKQFLELGLLSIAHEKTRAGSKIKYYWMAADNFIIKLHDNPELLRQHYITLLEIYNEITLNGLKNTIDELSLKPELNIVTTDNEFLFYRLVHNNGTTCSSFKQELLKANSPATLAVWRHLQLNFQDAKALQKELSALLEKYQSKTMQGNDSYYFQTSLVAGPK